MKETLNGFTLKNEYQNKEEVTMIFRELQESETDFLAEMLYAAIFIPKGHDPLPKEIVQDPSLSKYIENWGRDQYDVALVAEKDNQLVGAIWGRLFSSDNKGFGFVDEDTPEISMAVKKGFRNQGIGTSLLQKIESEYQKMSVGGLSLSVDKANDASKLYKRVGYEIYRETDTSWTMKKRL